MRCCSPHLRSWSPARSWAAEPRHVGRSRGKSTAGGDGWHTGKSALCPPCRIRRPLSEMKHLPNQSRNRDTSAFKAIGGEDQSKALFLLGCVKTSHTHPPPPLGAASRPFRLLLRARGTKDGGTPSAEAPSRSSYATAW